MTAYLRPADGPTNASNRASRALRSKMPWQQSAIEELLERYFNDESLAVAGSDRDAGADPEVRSLQRSLLVEAMHVRGEGTAEMVQFLARVIYSTLRTPTGSRPILASRAMTQSRLRTESSRYMQTDCVMHTSAATRQPMRSRRNGKRPPSGLWRVAHPTRLLSSNQLQSGVSIGSPATSVATRPSLECVRFAASRSRNCRPRYQMPFARKSLRSSDSSRAGSGSCLARRRRSNSIRSIGCTDIE